MAADVKNERAPFYKPASFVKADGLNRRIDENVRKQGAGYHGFEVLEKGAADPSPLVLRRNVQKPDFVHVQPCNPYYMVLQFVNSDIEKPGAFIHALRRFEAAELF